VCVCVRGGGDALWVKAGSSVEQKKRHSGTESYGFSLTWKPPSYMVHGLVSAHLEVTKGVGRHFLQGVGLFARGHTPI